MSTLRVSNIEAKADPSSPSVDEKLKVTNSNGDVLIHIDGKTAGITTVGINTTDSSFTVDAAQNVEFLGIVTATKFSLSGGGEITGGDGNFTGIVTSGSGNFTGGLNVGTAVTAATANFTSSLTAASANFTGNVSIAGTLTYEDVTNVDSIGIATARTGIDVTGGHIDLIDNSKIRVGTGDDLQIYHDSNNSWISDEGTGSLKIRSVAGQVQILGTGSNDNMAVFTVDGASELYYDNSKKLETTTTGAKVTGALEVTQEYPSIRPTLDLNFAATKTLDRRITFKRGSIGTYVDENGLVKYASNNVPRFDHNPATGESLGLLIEESRTNYSIYSSEFDNAAHQKLNATVVANQAVAPDGTNTAYLMYPNSSGSGRGITDSYVLTTGVYTTTVYVKTAGLQWIALYGVNGAGRGYFDIVNGTAGGSDNTGLVTYGIEDADNGWYRCYVTINITDVSGSEYYYIYFGDSDNSVSVTANGTNGIYMWGLQTEKGSFPTSYIPTSGSTVTRAQDTAKITGTNFTDFYNQTEGTLVAHYHSTVDDNYIATFENVTTPGDDRIGLVNYAGYQGFVETDNSGQASLDNGTPTVGAVNKVAFAFKRNDFAVSLNSATPVTDTSGTMPTVGRMMIGSRQGGTYDVLKSTLRHLSYYPKRLPNAQLQGLTQQ